MTSVILSIDDGFQCFGVVFPGTTSHFRRRAPRRVRLVPCRGFYPNLPELTVQDIQPGGSGVRAQALDRSGNLLDDFYFVWQDRFLHVCNVPSPAATASLVIGREIVAKLEENADLGKVQNDEVSAQT